MFEVDQLRLLGVAALAAMGMALSLYGFVFMGVRSRRARLSSGDVCQTVQAVFEETTSGANPKSYGSFAQAALGEFGSARRALLSGSAPGGPVAEDYCLCSCVLMAAFEEDSSRALLYAEQLVRLPLEGERHRARRSGVISVARVLAGVVDDEDWEYLNAAPVWEPVMLWPCRYAVACILRGSGHRDQVMRLIGSAPPWPATSHFARLHAELTEQRGESQGRPEAA